MCIKTLFILPLISGIKSSKNNFSLTPEKEKVTILPRLGVKWVISLIKYKFQVYIWSLPLAFYSLSIMLISTV